jgi:hypothetical protein
VPGETPPEVGTSEIDRDARPTESFDRLHVEFLGSLIFYEQRLRARRDPESLGSFAG